MQDSPKDGVNVLAHGGRSTRANSPSLSSAALGLRHFPPAGAAHRVTCPVQTFLRMGGNEYCNLVAADGHVFANQVLEFQEACLEAGKNKKGRHPRDIFILFART